MDDSMESYGRQIVDFGIDILGALIILVIGCYVAKWVAGFIRNKLAANERVDDTLAVFFAQLAKYSILAFVGIAVLNQFGIQTASLIAIFGAAGLAIGLAMQGTLSDLAAGVMLLMFRPFKIGEYIEAGGQAGTVEAISLFTTKLNTPDNVHIIAPNGDVWGSAVKNYSHNELRRVDIAVGIGYGASIETGISAAKDVLTSDSRTLSEPEPLVAVTDLGDSAVNLTLRVWCKRDDYWGVKFDLTRAVKERLDAEGVDIPFPQRTVHLMKPEEENGTP